MEAKVSPDGLPRECLLQERIHDLEKYVEVLKQEKEQLTSGSQSSLNSPNSNVRRVSSDTSQAGRVLNDSAFILNSCQFFPVSVAKLILSACCNIAAVHKPWPAAHF